MKDNKRGILKCEFQRMPTKLVAWFDTDFAGCWRARRSTSGGVVIFGSHCLKTCSNTQDVIVSPSGESEFHGILKTGSLGLGVAGLMKELGV